MPYTRNHYDYQSFVTKNFLNMFWLLLIAWGIKVFVPLPTKLNPIPFLDKSNVRVCIVSWNEKYYVYCWDSRFSLREYKDGFLVVLLRGVTWRIFTDIPHAECCICTRGVWTCLALCGRIEKSRKSFNYKCSPCWKRDFIDVTR